ncbi:Trichosetin synthetase PKS-NRPS1 [Fusarium oxysporum f. sp. albedinis]|nr:Trichosetin synthetase PKS-NRPS1 [Fusarium oxysporum f. sp. albedinis]
MSLKPHSLISPIEESAENRRRDDSNPRIALSFLCEQACRVDGSPISGNKGEADLPSTDTNCQAPPSPPTEFHGRQLPKGIKGI